MKKLFVIAALLGMVFTASAQEKKDDTRPQSEAVSRIRLANQLARYGYQTYSASALIEAAQILSEIETQALKPESFTQGEGDEVAKSSGNPEFTLENLIADAKKFADGDQTLLALADRVKVTPDESRGRLGGPGRGVYRVPAGSTDRFVIAFKYGIPAEIFVSGDGDTDLDLYVYDENGNLITGDDDYSDDCYVCWTPAWTGNFVVNVVNRGRVYNEYLMVTN
jgi:hypothetical protein